MLATNPKRRLLRLGGGLPTAGFALFAFITSCSISTRTRTTTQ